MTWAEFRRLNAGQAPRVRRDSDCLPRNGPFYPAGFMRVETERRLAIVCGLGPSLAASLDIIKEYRDRTFVIAPVRSAIRLVECGIVPDVVVLLEAGNLQYELTRHKITSIFLSALKQNSIPLVAHVTAPRGLVQMFRENGRVFYFGDANLSAEIFLPNNAQSLCASVALGIQLGFSKVGLLGVDADRRTFPSQIAAIESFGRLSGISRLDFGNGEPKRGWRTAGLLNELRRSPAGPASPTGRCCAKSKNAAARVLREDRRELQRLRPRIERASAEAWFIAVRCLESKVTSEEYDRLRMLQNAAECDWRHDPLKRDAIELLEAAYLPAFWQSGKSFNLAPDRKERAITKRGLLFYRELQERLSRMN